MSLASKTSVSKYDEILDTAQDLIQSRGYNGFSYRDIAAAINIKSASIHYHFPKKGDLGQAVAARYCDRFSQLLKGLTQNADSTQQLLKSYAALFRDTLVERERLCLCGMLAGEVETVPANVTAEVARFFDEQHQWLAESIQTGIEKGEVSTGASANVWAVTFLSALEGGMLIARGLKDNDYLDIAADNIIQVLLQTEDA